MLVGLLLGLVASWTWWEQPTTTPLAQREAQQTDDVTVAASPVTRAPSGDREAAAIVGRVSDQAGRPLMQASVCASMRTPGSARPLSAHCVYSERDGSYRMPPLGAGEYRLVAAAQGHLPGAAREQPGAIVLPARDTPLRRDFALSAGGARVIGTVQDSEGGAIEAAHVEALASQGQVAAVVSVLTDENGDFALSTYEGPLTLRVRAEGYAESLYVTTAPSAAVRIELGAAARLVGEIVSETDEETLGGIVVTAAEQAARSFASVASATTDEAGRFRIEGLSAGSYTLEAHGARTHGRLSQPVVIGVGETRDGLRLRLDAGVAVLGRVLLGAAKRPCAGAQLSITGPSFRALSRADSATGAFRFEAVPPGTFDLHASCPSAAREHPTGHKLQVGANDLTDVELVLQESVSLHGRVVDSRGRAVSERRVVAEPLAPNMPGATAVSAAHGEFELTGLTPGGYRVALEHWAETSRSVTLSEGMRAQQLVLQMPVGGTMRVQLRATSGAIDDDWAVHAWSGQVQRLARRLGAGAYELTDLPDGRYEVSAYDPSGTSVSTTYEVRDHQRADLALNVPERSGQITGSVSDDHGAPAAEVRILVVATGGAPSGSHGGRFVLSDRDGSFSLDRLSRQGRYDLSAESPLDGAAKLSAVAVGSHVHLQLAGPPSAPVGMPAGVLTAGSTMPPKEVANVGATPPTLAPAMIGSVPEAHGPSSER